MARTAGGKQPTPSLLELVVQVGVQSVARRISSGRDEVDHLERPQVGGPHTSRHA
jgi:hypothetical protein